MNTDYLLALTIPPVLMLIWVAVQRIWRRYFDVPDVHGDVLAGRGDCGNCDCASHCDENDSTEKNRLDTGHLPHSGELRRH